MLKASVEVVSARALLRVENVTQTCAGIAGLGEMFKGYVLIYYDILNHIH